MKDLRGRILTVLIVIGTVILLAVIINGVYLLKENVKQNNKLINLIETFQFNTSVGTEGKYQ